MVISLNFVRGTLAFQYFLELRYSHSERLQIQSKFLVDHGRLIPLLVIGDKDFIDAFREENSLDERTEFIYIKGFASEDVVSGIDAIKVGESLGKTKICEVVFQASPNFLLRARAIGTSQRTAELKSIRDINLFDPMGVKNTFDLVQRWITLRDERPFDQLDSNRVEKYVGQAQFEDSTFENWNKMKSRIERFNKNMHFVLDVESTDWGNGDLLQKIPTRLDELALENAHLTWSKLGENSSQEFSGCAESGFS